MHLTLSALGVDTAIPLFRVSVGEDGRWTYESKAVAESSGELTEADRTQLKSLYDKVEWGQEVLNNPISADDRILFRLEVTHNADDHRLYQFSEAMNHLSWQFRDLVHFLRHNVATGGDPVGPVPDTNYAQPATGPSPM